MVKFINEHNACPSYTKVLFICGISFFAITLNSQSLHLVDRIYGGVGHLSGLQINSEGQRFYLLKDLYDSLIINDNYFPLPHKDPNIGSPYFWGRDYLISISDTSIFLRRPGGTAIGLNDSSLFVASSFTEDTLVTEDSVFVNNSNGKSENLLIIQYDFNGNVLQSKHWSPQCTCLLTINNLIINGNEIFFCGEYSSVNGIYLDQSILVPGYANGYFASMDDELTMNDVSPIQGMSEEYFIKMAKNTEKNFLVVGSSTSYRIEFCDDTLINQAVSSWGTTFLFSILYDSYGNCLNSKTIDYDYGGIISTSITGLPDNSFLVSGIYNSSFISLDGITLLNSNNEQRGFLYKFNNHGDLIDAFQLEGSAGSKRIESVVHDSHGNIWITGENQADTLQIGQFSLFAEAPGEIFGYLARLNSNLEPDFVLKLSGRSYNLILGDDDNIYLIEYLLQADDDYRLYEIILPPNLVENNDANSKINIAIYPNPVWNSSHVNYKFLNPGIHLIERINVYNVHGIKIESRIANANQGIIDLDSFNNVVFVEFLLENGSKVIKKVLANQ